MALAVGGRAGAHGDGAVLLDLAGAELGAEPGPLDVRAEADAELSGLAALAPRGLLGAQLRVAGRLQHAVQRAPVRARVVVRAGDRLVRELADEVDPAHLGRVHPDLAANMSIARSISAVASGRPAPR